MQDPDQPVLRDIVLVGGGHSHVGVLRRFAMDPLPGVRLNLICSDSHTPYSGMLPGYIAGHYDYDEVHIDLDRLCVFAGARLFRAEAIGIDRATKRVLCRDRPAIAYDVLSINIGSTPQMARVARRRRIRGSRSSRFGSSTTAGWPCSTASGAIRAAPRSRSSGAAPGASN